LGFYLGFIRLLISTSLKAAITTGSNGYTVTVAGFALFIALVVNQQIPLYTWLLDAAA
jgi:hypothetical protein